MNTVKDLAEEHRLISDIFKWPTSKEEWEQYRLTEDQVAHFQEYGYLAGVKLLNDEQVEV